MKKRKDIPPTYFYIGFALVPICWLAFPGFSLIGFPESLLGLSVTALGTALVYRTWKLFMKHATPEDFSESTYLVTEGPYRHSRNPMYLGMCLFLLGLALASGNPVSLVSPAFFLLVMHFRFIPYEERKMEKTFGKSYLDYRKRVRRWL